MQYETAQKFKTAKTERGVNCFGWRGGFGKLASTSLVYWAAHEGLDG